MSNRNRLRIARWHNWRSGHINRFGAWLNRRSSRHLTLALDQTNRVRADLDSPKENA